MTILDKVKEGAKTLLPKKPLTKEETARNNWFTAIGKSAENKMKAKVENLNRKKNWEAKWAKRAPGFIVSSATPGQPFRQYNDRKTDRKKGTLKFSEQVKKQEHEQSIQN